MKKVKYFALLLVAGTLGFGLTSCDKDDDNDDNNNSGTLTEATNYAAVGTVDGQSVNITDGYVTINHTGSNTGILTSNVVFGTKVQNTVSDATPAVEVRFGDLYYSSNNYADKDLFYNYFVTGSGQFTYGIDASGSTSERKVNIIYTDANGDVWRTTDGSGAQAGSTFEITQMLQLNKESGYVLKFRAKFHCNLYNGDGDMITADFTNFVGQVETYE